MMPLPSSPIQILGTNRLVRDLLKMVVTQQKKITAEFAQSKERGILSLQEKELFYVPENPLLDLKEGTRFKVFFVLNDQIYFFLTALQKPLSQRGYGILFPEQIYKLRRRRIPRYKPQSEFPLFVFFPHPFSRSQKIRGKVINFNTQGIKFSLPKEESFLIEGLPIDELCLNLPFETTIRTQGNLKYYLPSSQNSTPHHCYGLAFSGFSPADQERLYAYYLSHDFPKLKHRSEMPFEQMWDLFHVSGYLEEKDPLFFRGMKENARQAWERLASNSFDISQDLVFVNEGTPLATVSSTRLYEKSWMFHQLAVHPTKVVEGHVYNDIYFGGVVDFALNNQQIDYFVAYYNVNRTWHKKFFEQFAASLTHSTKIQVDTFHHYETVLTPIPFEPPPPPWEISEPTPSEKEKIILELKKRFSPVVQEACNFDLLNFDLPVTRTTYDQRGLQRERRCLILKKGGSQILAFAIMESATSGINIFNLMDSAWAFYLKETPEIQNLLLQGICRHYQGLAKKSFLLLVQNEDPEPYKMLGFKEVCGLKRIIFHRDLFQDYRDYLFLLFSRITVDSR